MVERRSPKPEVAGSIPVAPATICRRKKMLKKFGFYRFYEQVKQEAIKVIWPTKNELLMTTGVVILVVCVVSFICLFLDYGIHSIIKLLLNIGK